MDSDEQSVTNFTNSVEVISSEELLKYGSSAVRRDTVLFSTGSLRVHTYWSSPGGVVVLPIRDDGKIIMIEQYRYLVGKRCWELPAGGIKDDEIPDQAALRELEEEAGVQARSLMKIGAFYPSNGLSNEIVYVYLARELLMTAQKLDPTEADILLSNVDLEKAVEMVWQGQIPGSSSIIAILYFYFHWRHLIDSLHDDSDADKAST